MIVFVDGDVVNVDPGVGVVQGGSFGQVDPHVGLDHLPPVSGELSGVNAKILNIPRFLVQYGYRQIWNRKSKLLMIWIF